MASGEPNWPVPMKAIGAQNLLTMPGGVTIAGYLHKRGGKQLQLFKWPLRYVIIHKGCVYYFKTSTSASSQGAFSLNGYNRVMRAAEETTSNNVFPFKMVHISKKHRTWYFSAASEEERKKWMLALRKEIDHYHEKKETITDLSESGESGSDADSFYGSVERPVDIKYVHNPEEDSWQDDEDEDDDDGPYVTPDSVDDDAPSYPPPPVPRGRSDAKAEEHQARNSISGVGLPKPPPPAPKRLNFDLDLTRPKRDYTDLNRIDLNVKPPPIPPFPPAHKPFEFKPPPPVPINNSTDRTDKPPSWPRTASPGFSVFNDINPSSFPPFPNKSSQSSEEMHSNSVVGNKQLNEELTNLFKKPPSPPTTLKLGAPATEEPPSHIPALVLPRKPSFATTPLPPTKPSCFTGPVLPNKPSHIPAPLPPNKPSHVPAPLPPNKPSHVPAPLPPNKPSHVPAPLPPNKPSHIPAPLPPNKPNHIPAPLPPIKPSHIPAPIPPTKPSYISSNTEDNIPPPTPSNKPISPEPSSSVMKTGPNRPPLVVPRVRPPKPNIGFSPIMRSPPDGQSFMDKTVDTPIRPARAKDLHEDSDSDSDYEKVSLPPSVYVDTCESLDVERMFKAIDITGSPLNGLFCIRNSAKAGKVIVVWDKEDDKIRNYRIFQKDTKVYLEGQILFTDMASLVEHYYSNPLPGHNTLVLRHAYGCINSPR